MPIAAARTANIFGPADPHLDHIIPGTLLALLRGERPEIRSDGSPSKGYLHVSDIVSAYVLLGERAAGLDVRGRAFNIHPDEPITVLDLVRLMMKVADRPDLEPNVTRQSNNHEHVWLANERAKRILGWEQRLARRRPAGHPELAARPRRRGAGARGHRVPWLIRLPWIA